MPAQAPAHRRCPATGRVLYAIQDAGQRGHGWMVIHQPTTYTRSTPGCRFGAASMAVLSRHPHFHGPMRGAGRKKPTPRRPNTPMATATLAMP